MSFRGPAVKTVGVVWGAVMASWVVGARAQTVQEPQSPQQLERVEITGSAIRRVPQEGPAPVEIITRKDIERTGATTVNELLRSIPSVDFNDFGELLSNSPSASGTTRISMRGLGSSDVLVLLNGRRLPVNAIYDASGEGATVDVNMIPLAAIERIEILKDGGSAIYGADAIAGVFNIITRRDYQGVALRASHGQSSRNDGRESSAGFTMGLGDLSSQRVNVLFSVDYFNRAPIQRSERDISKSADFTRFGGADMRSVLAPTGNIIDPNTGALVGVPYKPCPPENQSNGGLICRYDFNASVLSAYNSANRLSSMALATVQLTPEVRGFVEATFARSENTFEGHPVPGLFLVPALDASQSVYRDITVPITGSNPFGSLYILGRFMQGGPRITERESSLLNLATGVEGTWRGLDWKASLTHGVSRVTNSDQNYYNATLWAAATGNGLIDPTVNTNSTVLIDSLKVSPQRVAHSTLDALQVQANGDAWQLPAGTVQYAVGASFSREVLVDTPDPLLQAGNVAGAIQQSGVDAGRNFSAAFVEFKVPLARTVEAQLALRHDEYSTASATSPKAALGWQVLPNWLVRGSYSHSFRAPVLKQLYGAQEQSAATVTDADLCQILVSNPVCTQAVFLVSGSNRNLSAEKAVTWNLGTVFDYQAVAVSIDYWRITKDKAIDAPSMASAIRRGLYYRVGPQIYVNTNLYNLAQAVDAGVDVDWRLRLPTAWGKATVRNVTTYYSESAERESGADWASYNGTYGKPRWRNKFGVTLENGPWTHQFSIRSTGGFSDSDQPMPHSAGTNRVGAYEEFDVQLSRADVGGLRGLTLTGGIQNLTDRQPPFSQQNATSASYSQMGFAELYSSRGRFYYLSMSYATK